MLLIRDVVSLYAPQTVLSFLDPENPLESKAPEDIVSHLTDPSAKPILFHYVQLAEKSWFVYISEAAMDTTKNRMVAYDHGNSESDEGSSLSRRISSAEEIEAPIFSLTDLHVGIPASASASSLIGDDDSLGSKLATQLAAFYKAPFHVSVSLAEVVSPDQDNLFFIFLLTEVKRMIRQFQTENPEVSMRYSKKLEIEEKIQGA